jgi:hypothetical protein
MKRQSDACEVKEPSSRPKKPLGEEKWAGRGEGEKEEERLREYRSDGRRYLVRDSGYAAGRPIRAIDSARG